MKLLGVFLKTYVMKILLDVLVEEFILLLPHTDIIQAEKIAERCRQALQELTIFNNQNIQIHVSASFGISSSALQMTPIL